MPAEHSASPRLRNNTNGENNQQMIKLNNTNKTNSKNIAGNNNNNNNNGRNTILYIWGALTPRNRSFQLLGRSVPFGTVFRWFQNFEQSRGAVPMAQTKLANLTDTSNTSTSVAVDR